MSTNDDHPNDETVRVPIVQEQLRVDRLTVETGRVVVQSTVQTENVSVQDVLASTTISVERHAVGRFVDAAPAIRTEGDRTIIPVTEEVMVKRIRLIEEIHLIREERFEAFEQDFTLRRLRVDVERHPARDRPDDAE